MRAFDGRRGSVCSPRLSEGSATRATGEGPWGSRGRRRRSAPPGQQPGDGKARRVGAGFIGIPSLERDILVVQADRGVMCRRPASALLLGTLRLDGRQVHMPASLEEYEPNVTKEQAEIAHNGHSIISESEQGNHVILLGTIGQKAR